MKKKIFTHFNIPVYLYASALLIPLLLIFQVGLSLGLTISAIIYTSLYLHELGHALTGKMVGGTVHEINLNVIGGSVKIDIEGGPKSDALVSIAGPLVNLGIAAISTALLFVAPVPAVPVWLLNVFSSPCCLLMEVEC